MSPGELRTTRAPAWGHESPPKSEVSPIFPLKFTASDYR